MMPNTLTCVYCGMAYPEGTPPHGSKILTDHIKICEKHPMRDAEITIAKLRARVAELEKLAYPDGPAGDAGISCKRYMTLEAEVERLRIEGSGLRVNVTESRKEIENLQLELKLCNRSRKWWKSLAYEANAEKISCRAATIKQNEEAAIAAAEGRE